MQQVKMTSNETALDFAKSYQTSCVAEPEAHTVTTTPAPEPALMPSSPPCGTPPTNDFSFSYKNKSP